MSQQSCWWALENLALNVQQEQLDYETGRTSQKHLRWKIEINTPQKNDSADGNTIKVVLATNTCKDEDGPAISQTGKLAESLASARRSRLSVSPCNKSYVQSCHLHRTFAWCTEVIILFGVHTVPTDGITLLRILATTSFPWVPHCTLPSGAYLSCRGWLLWHCHILNWSLHNHDVLTSADGISSVHNHTRSLDKESNFGREKIDRVNFVISQQGVF